MRNEETESPLHNPRRLIFPSIPGMFIEGLALESTEWSS